MLIPVIQNGLDLFVDSASIAIPWNSVFGKPTQINAFSVLPNSAGVLTNDGAGNLSWVPSGGGSVTSVGLAAPAGFTVSGSPVTTAGTLTLNYAAGYQGYTTLESAKLATIETGATVGAAWSTNLTGIPTIVSNFAALANAAGFLKNDGAGNLSWSSTAGLGTVVQVNTGNGTTGGPITSSGTVSVDTNFAFNWTGQHKWDVPLWIPEGSAASPGLTWQGDPDTGIYWVGADNFGFSTNGVARWDIDTTRVQQIIDFHVLDPDPTHIRNGLLNGVRTYTTTSTVSTLPLAPGISIGAIWGPTSGADGVGGSIAFNEAGGIYGFNIRWTGEDNNEGNLVWYRHNNSAVGSQFLLMRRNTDQLLFGTGSAGAPVLSFIGDDDTGVYGLGTNQLGISTAGILRLTVDATAFTATLPWRGASGSFAAPTFSFSADTNTGMYRVGADVLGFAVAGALAYQIGAAGQFGIGGATYGTAGQVIVSAGAAAPPVWGVADIVGGGTGLSTYTAGDILYATSSTVLAKLAIGANGTVLTVVAGSPAWVVGGGGGSPLTTKGDIYTFTTVDARLPVGTDGYLLSANSAASTGLSWVAPGSGASPLTTKGDLYTFTTVDARLPVGANGQVLTADSTAASGVAWAASAALNPQSDWEDFSDLVWWDGVDGFKSGVSSGGSVAALAVAGHPGVVEISSGTNATTSNGILKSSTPLTTFAPLLVGSGVMTYETLVEIPTLFAGGNTGQLRMGLMDEITGAPSNAIHAQYDNTTANWQLYARAATVATSVTGGTAVTTGWHYIKIVVNAAGTSAELFVDGVSQGTVSSGLPTAGMSYGNQVQKTALTTAMIQRVDFVRVRQTLTTPRY